jgi:putative ABC transport system substrate-binding protein
MFRSALLAILSLAAACNPPVDATKAEGLSLSVIDFRKPALHKEFAIALKRELSTRPAAARIGKVSFVTCTFGERAIDDCVSEALATRPSLVYATTTTIALAVRTADRSVPVLFSGTLDPRSLGLVERLERPGGNLTGFVSFSDTFAMRIEKLKSVFPRTMTIGILVERNVRARMSLDELQAQVAAAGVVLRLVEADPEANGQQLMDLVCRVGVDAFDVPTSAFLRRRTQDVIRALNACGKPAIFEHSDFVREGGLMSYGVEGFDYAAKAAEYLQRMLSTTSIGDIPIEFADNARFSINREAAARLRAAAAQGMFRSADAIF